MCYTPRNGLVVFATPKNPHLDPSLTSEWQINQKLQLGKPSKKKNSKKGDIVTIRSATYLPYLISDIKISDICFKNLYLPTLVK